GFFAFDANFNPIVNFDPSTVDVIVDLRRRNLSAVNVRGLDASFNYQFELGAGRATAGLTATYLIDRKQRVTSDSLPFDTVNTFANPAAFRARAHATYDRDPFSLSTFVNYAGPYRDNRIVPARDISSYLTVDLRAAVSVGHAQDGAAPNFEFAV